MRRGSAASISSTISHLNGTSSGSMVVCPPPSASSSAMQVLKQELAERFRAIINILQNGGEIARELIELAAIAARTIARQMRFSDGVATAIQNTRRALERRRQADGIAGEEIHLFARIALLAQVVDVFRASEGKEAASARSDCAAAPGSIRASSRPWRRSASVMNSGSSSGPTTSIQPFSVSNRRNACDTSTRTISTRSPRRLPTSSTPRAPLRAATARDSLCSPIWLRKNSGSTRIIAAG